MKLYINVILAKCFNFLKYHVTSSQFSVHYIFPFDLEIFIREGTYTVYSQHLLWFFFIVQHMELQNICKLSYFIFQLTAAAVLEVAAVAEEAMAEVCFLYLKHALIIGLLSHCFYFHSFFLCYPRMRYLEFIRKKSILFGNEHQLWVGLVG